MKNSSCIFRPLKIAHVAPSERGEPNTRWLGATFQKNGDTNLLVQRDVANSLPTESHLWKKNIVICNAQFSG